VAAVCYREGGLEVDEGEAAVIREAASRVLAGETPNSIARDLSRRGITAADGSGAFYTRRLKRILVNPRITGLRAYKGEVIRDATWPAILPRETWEAVRAILNDPARGRGGHSPRWPLAGVAICGLCKVPMRTNGACALPRPRDP
jgi:site-specific DNA recombinase